MWQIEETTGWYSYDIEMVVDQKVTVEIPQENLARANRRFQCLAVGPVHAPPAACPSLTLRRWLNPN